MTLPFTFRDLCAAIGFVAILTTAAIAIVALWSACVAPQLARLRLRARYRQWRAQRAAIERVIAASLTGLPGMRACAQYRATGRLEVRDGLISDFCTKCGQSFGEHVRHRTAAR